MTTKTKAQPTAAEVLRDLEHRLNRGDEGVTVEMLVAARRDAEDEEARQIAELRIHEARKVRLAAERVDAIAESFDEVSGENKRRAALARVRRAVAESLEALDDLHAERSALINELRALATDEVGINGWRIGDRVRGSESSVSIDGRSIRAMLPEHQIRDAVDAGFRDWRSKRKAESPRRRRPAPPTVPPTPDADQPPAA